MPRSCSKPKLRPNELKIVDLECCASENDAQNDMKVAASGPIARGLCEDHIGTYVIPFLANGAMALGKMLKPGDHRSCGDRLAGSQTQSALNLQILSRSFAPVRDLLVFYRVPVIETSEANIAKLPALLRGPKPLR